MDKKMPVRATASFMMVLDIWSDESVGMNASRLGGLRDRFWTRRYFILPNNKAGRAVRLIFDVIWILDASRYSLDCPPSATGPRHSTRGEWSLESLVHFEHLIET